MTQDDEQTVSLFGKKIALTTHASSLDPAGEQILEIEEIRSHLEELFAELKRANPKLKQEALLILMNINLMDQLLNLKKEMKIPADQEIAARASQLISLIDSGIIGNTNSREHE